MFLSGMIVLSTIVATPFIGIANLAVGYTYTGVFLTVVGFLIWATLWEMNRY